MITHSGVHSDGGKKSLTPPPPWSTLQPRSAPWITHQDGASGLAAFPSRRIGLAQASDLFDPGEAPLLANGCLCSPAEAAVRQYGTHNARSFLWLDWDPQRGPNHPTAQ